MTTFTENVADRTFAPWRGGVGGVRMGLAPIAEDEWLRVPPDLDDRLAQKRDLYASRYDDVVAQLSESDEACEELAHMLAARIGFRRNAERCAIADAGLRLADDLCIMQPGPAGYVLTAASLCTPSNWRLHDKLGKPMLLIHKPIEQLEERIGETIAGFFDRLPPGRIFMRGNWHLNQSPTLFQMPKGKKRQAATVTAENIGERVWVRTERQTLRRLAGSDAIVFTILVEATQLAQLAGSPALVQDLVLAYEGLHPADQAMRHWQTYEAPLRAFCKRL